MCSCEPTFVCSRCSGDPRQDWRLAFEADPADDAERRWHDAILASDGPVRVKPPRVQATR